MSKTTQSYPSYTNSTVKIGGSRASSYLGPNGHNLSYQMSNPESQVYNYALDTLADILPKINTFDENTIKSLQSSVDAYRNAGYADINNYYNNSLSNLKNDIVSRFGNLDNSVFTQNFNTIENNRANAVSNFAQSVLARQQELENNELARRYDLMNAMAGMYDNIYGKALNALGLTMNGSSNYNSYNNSAYNAMNSANNNAQTQAAQAIKMAGLLGLI